MDVGQNIKKKRKESGLSQAQLSRLSGISQSAISDIENPNVTKRPNTDTISKIASALGCTVAELMGENIEKTAALSDDGADETKMLNLYRQLPPEKKSYVQGVLEGILEGRKP